MFCIYIYIEREREREREKLGQIKKKKKKYDPCKQPYHFHTINNSQISFNFNLAPAMPAL